MKKKCKYKIAIIGHFAQGRQSYDGQIVKTRLISEELKRLYGDKEILEIDTIGGVKTLLKAPFQALNALRKAQNVIILPCLNAVRVYAPLLAVLKMFFNDRKLHHILIGGWLPQFVQKRKILYLCLKHFDAIYPETHKVKIALDDLGFRNVQVLRNFKNIAIVDENNTSYSSDFPLKLCTFSRVTQKKGIGDLVDAILAVNSSLQKNAFCLDIYGKVGEEDASWFEELKNRFGESVQYCGVVDPKQSVSVLKDYFALAFPTRHFTEGIPGTIIDAYASGIPVISAKWDSYSDVIDDQITGLGYEFENIEDLKRLLLEIAHNPQTLIDMRLACIKKAEEFMPDFNLKILMNELA